MNLSRRAALLGSLAAASAAAAQTLLQKAPKGAALRPPSSPTLSNFPLDGIGGGLIPVRVWWPAEPPFAVAVFSHGANSNAAKYDPLTSALAAAGIGVSAPIHADSPDHPDRIAEPAAPAIGFARRIAECRVVMEHLTRAAPGVPLLAAGHSYGALIALMLGGAATLNLKTEADPRVRLALAFSPPGAFPGVIDAAGFARTRVPLWVQTGTADALPPMMPDWRAHKLAFEAATVSPRALWVGDGVDHYFGNRIGRPERPADAAQAALFDQAIAHALDFTSALLLNDAAARARLRVHTPGVNIALR